MNNLSANITIIYKSYILLTFPIDSRKLIFGLDNTMITLKENWLKLFYKSCEILATTLTKHRMENYFKINDMAGFFLICFDNNKLNS